MKTLCCILITLLLLAVFGVSLASFAAIAEETGFSLEDVENNLYGRNYTEEPLEERLARIETLIFGHIRSEDPHQRQQNLESFFAKNMIKTVPNASNAINQPEKSDLNSPLRDATDYPAITQLEQKLFQQSYAGEYIAKRLTRLEKEIFKQTFEELPMVDRVDQLTLKVMPDNPLSVEESGMSSIPALGQDLASSNLAIYSQLTTLEEKILGKTFGGELIVNRLSRLERQILGSTQNGSIDSRMERLLSSYVKIFQKQQYNNNVGEIQTYTPTHPKGLTYPSYPKQVTVGPMLGEQSFSKDFIEMLPSSVKQQLKINGSGVATGVPIQSQYEFVYPDTGTYNYQYQQRYAPYGYFQQPGQVYPNAIPKKQYDNKLDPMRFPGGALGAIGQEQYYNNNQNNNPYGSYSFSPVQQGWETHINQSLVLLETAVFGRTFEGTNFIVRLNNLEQQVFGKIYPQYPPQQRINRLMKRSTYKQSTDLMIYKLMT